MELGARTGISQTGWQIRKDRGGFWMPCCGQRRTSPEAQRSEAFSLIAEALPWLCGHTVLCFGAARCSNHNLSPTCPPHFVLVAWPPCSLRHSQHLARDSWVGGTCSLGLRVYISTYRSSIAHLPWEGTTFRSAPPTPSSKGTMFEDGSCRSCGDANICFGSPVLNVSAQRRKIRLLFFFFLRLHLEHMEVPRTSAEAYTTATVTQDLSCICDLLCSLWQNRTLKNHWARPGIEPTSSRTLFGFLAQGATTGTVKYKVWNV